VQEAGVFESLAEPSHVIPIVERLETVTVPEVTMKAMNVLGALALPLVVDNPVIVKVVPELQVPVFSELAFPSRAGTEPIARLVSTVDVEAVPEVVDNPLHSVPHVPTVVGFVKKV
jgi:hypothetical protein